VTEFTAADDRTVKETVAGNVRAFRQLRSMDQADLARRMYSLSMSWSRVTVSEVERGERNVTVAELLSWRSRWEPPSNSYSTRVDPSAYAGPTWRFTTDPRIPPSARRST